MDTYLPMVVHEEYAKRMEAEHSRQNARIKKVEEKVEDLEKLTVSVGSLAKSMEQMLEEQKNQGERLQTLEGRDGAKWRAFIGYVLASVVSVVVGVALGKLGIV